MAWEFGYRMKLTVMSQQHSLSELKLFLLPLTWTPRKTRKGRPSTCAVWERMFSSVPMTQDDQDGFEDDLGSAVKLMVPVMDKLLELSSTAQVYFLIQIFKEGHAVFVLNRKSVASLCNLELPVYFEFYNYDLKP